MNLSDFLKISFILVICSFLRLSNAAESDARVYNGVTSKSGQMPYQVFLKITDRSGSGALCGGSLIHPSWVLTAAHCLNPDDSVTVSLGITDSQTKSNGVNIKASKIYVYENYNDKEILGDIALLKLSSPAPLGKNIKTIKLPASSYSDPRKWDYKKVCVSGWGDTTNKQQTVTRNMQNSLLQVMGHRRCSSYLGYSLTNGRLCTNKSFKNSGPCEGDSGGPLADCGGSCSCSGAPTLVGIVSFRTAENCKNGNPEVYTNVANYLDWIKSKMSN